MTECEHDAWDPKLGRCDWCHASAGELHLRTQLRASRTLLSLWLDLHGKEKASCCDVDRCERHADQARKVAAATRAELEAS